MHGARKRLPGVYYLTKSGFDRLTPSLPLLRASSCFSFSCQRKGARGCNTFAEWLATPICQPTYGQTHSIRAVYFICGVREQ